MTTLSQLARQGASKNPPQIYFSAKKVMWCMAVARCGLIFPARVLAHPISLPRKSLHLLRAIGKCCGAILVRVLVGTGGALSALNWSLSFFSLSLSLYLSIYLSIYIHIYYFHAIISIYLCWCCLSIFPITTAFPYSFSFPYISPSQMLAPSHVYVHRSMMNVFSNLSPASSGARTRCMPSSTL